MACLASTIVNNGVWAIAGGDLFVEKKGLCHWSRVRQTRGLDNYLVKIQLTCISFFGKIPQSSAKIIANAATDTAIAHHKDLLLAAGNDNLAIDVLFAKLVFNHSDLTAVSFSEQPAQERGFA